MQWIESGLNRRTLVGMAAWLVFTSGAVGATGFAIAGSTMTMLVKTADEGLIRSAVACRPCVRCYLA